MYNNMGDLLDDFERTMNRAVRNAKLFHGAHWEAHLETLQADELPELESKLNLLEENMKVFAGEPDEMERLDEAHEMVIREIAYLRERTHKKKGRKK